MAFVSILYLDWNFNYFITKACLNLYWQQRFWGGAEWDGGRGGGPGAPLLQPAPPATSCPLTTGLEGGGSYALQ